MYVTMELCKAPCVVRQNMSVKCDLMLALYADDVAQVLLHLHAAEVCPGGEYYRRMLH